MNKRTLALVAAVPVTVLTLTACGSSTTTTGAGATSTTGASATSSMPKPGQSTAGAMMQNAADVTFAQTMIPHHKQAVQMARLATNRASDSRVKDLAARIEAAQDPEIMKMTGMLDTWGAAMPGNMTGRRGMGMMSTTDMHTLTATRGAAFDKRFLTMMIAHHTAALTAAKAELNDAADADAKALAQSIIDRQTAEITQMKSLRRSG